MSLVDPQFFEKTSALRDLPKETPNYRNVIIEMVISELWDNLPLGYFSVCLDVAEELLGDDLYVEDDGTFIVIEDKEGWTWEYVERLIEHLRHKFSKAMVAHSEEVQRYARRHFPKPCIIICASSEERTRGVPLLSSRRYSSD